MIIRQIFCIPIPNYAFLVISVNLNTAIIRVAKKQVGVSELLKTNFRVEQGYMLQVNRNYNISIIIIFKIVFPLIHSYYYCDTDRNWRRHGWNNNCFLVTFSHRYTGWSIMQYHMNTSMTRLGLI